MAYHDMKVPDLKNLCQERGLSCQGSKHALIDRLRRSEEEQQQQQQQQHEAQLEVTSPSEASSPSAVLAANAASPVVEVTPLQLSLPQQPQQQPQQPQQQTEVVMSPGANVVIKQEPGASPIVEPMSIDEPLPTSRDRANDIGSTSTSTSSGGTTSTAVTASDASSTTGGSKDNTVVVAAAAMTPTISQGVNRKLLSRMVHERANVSSHLHQYYGRAFNSAERFDYEMLRQKLAASFVYTDYEIPWWCAESYDTAMGVCRVPGRPTESIVCINRD